MADIFFPTWADFDEVVSAASRELLICSPYFSADGLEHIEAHLQGSPVVRFCIRLSPSDWATGFSDPPALLSLIGRLRERSCDVDIGINQRLHAKVYAADDALLLLGSANLTSGGFGNNVELMVRLRTEDVRVALLAVSPGLEKNLRRLTFAQMAEWVASAAPIVDKVRQLNRDDDEATDMLVPVQSGLDDLLGYGKGTRQALPDLDDNDLDAFVTWLGLHPSLPGAPMLLLYKVANLQRNSGKFNQAFYGVSRFLRERPEFVDGLVADLAAMQPDDIYAFDDPALVDAWAQHLDSHALDRTPYFSYPTLRGYLTPQLGGTLTGGGGGGTTLKRMLPVVAQFLKDLQ